MVNPKKHKLPHRGTRPKHSLQNTHKVYCDRCECSYNVPNNRNGDQLLNSHWRHFNCLQKKILRQQEEDSSFVKKPRQPSQLRTDNKAFIIEGGRWKMRDRSEWTTITLTESVKRHSCWRLTNTLDIHLD